MELAHWLFVPTAGALLADWGADVIKVEHPVTGDGYRGLVHQGVSGSGVNPSMQMANRGKRSIALNLKSSGGHEVAMRLVGTADVFLTNHRPTVLERMGLSAEQLREVNPRLVYARGTGLGVRGEQSDLPAFDATAFWARGALGETLTPAGLPRPVPQRGGLGDRNAAVHLAFGVASALFRRSQTGEGSVIDVSLLSTAVWMLGSDVIAALQSSFQPADSLDPEIRQLPVNPLAADYRCRDGRYLTLCCLQGDQYWPDVCRVIGRLDLVADERFATNEARATHNAPCVEVLEAGFAVRTLAEWTEFLRDATFPWGPYQRVTELIDDPQVLANDYIGELAVDGERIRLPTGAVQVDERPPDLRQAPGHGQHTELVLQELGYDWDDISKLKDAGAVP
jgi:crotonobetainyl-CoA:carnitine CoA-transferase CaiB-like acyl-CoA transferase